MGNGFLGLGLLNDAKYGVIITTVTSIIYTFIDGAMLRVANQMTILY